MGNRSARGGRILRPADENERRHERLNSPEVSGDVERLEVRARARDDRDATVDQVPGASERDGAEGNHTPYRRLAECGEVAQASKGTASTSGGATGMGTFELSPAAARSVNRARSGAVGVRSLCRDLPPLRPSLADDAFQEHRAAFARHAIVMTGHVAANPIPHSTPYLLKTERDRSWARKVPAWDTR